MHDGLVHTRTLRAYSSLAWAAQLLGAIVGCLVQPATQSWEMERRGRRRCSWRAWWALSRCAGPDMALQNRFAASAHADFFSANENSRITSPGDSPGRRCFFGICRAFLTANFFFFRFPGAQRRWRTGVVADRDDHRHPGTAGGHAADHHDHLRADHGQNQLIVVLTAGGKWWRQLILHLKLGAISRIS